MFSVIHFIFNSIVYLPTDSLGLLTSFVYNIHGLLVNGFFVIELCCSFLEAFDPPGILQLQSICCGLIEI